MLHFCRDCEKKWETRVWTNTRINKSTKKYTQHKNQKCCFVGRANDFRKYFVDFMGDKSKEAAKKKVIVIIFVRLTHASVRFALSEWVSALRTGKMISNLFVCQWLNASTNTIFAAQTFRRPTHIRVHVNKKRTDSFKSICAALICQFELEYFARYFCCFCRDFWRSLLLLSPLNVQRILSSACRLLAAFEPQVHYSVHYCTNRIVRIQVAIYCHMHVFSLASFVLFPLISDWVITDYSTAQHNVIYNSTRMRILELMNRRIDSIPVGNSTDASEMKTITITKGKHRTHFTMLHNQLFSNDRASKPLVLAQKLLLRWTATLL